MSVPRQVLPGSTYLVTRRCSQRQFLLCPSDRTNRILRYCLALAALRYQVQLHAFCFLANHMHLVLTDPHTVLPEFMRYLNEMIARAINASLGRWENLWAPGTYSAVRLVAAEDVIDKVAYTLANPVAAGLVERARHWPGVISDLHDVDGCPIVAERPGAFFRDDGPTPESCAFRLTRPPGFAATADFVEPVESQLRGREDAAAEELRARNADFLGARAVLRQRPTDSPSTVEPRRALCPRVAAHDRWQRVEALRRQKSFLAAYHEAWLGLRARVANVLFPAGTYWLRVRWGVACASP